jgi:hypothetical protein
MHAMKIFAVGYVQSQWNNPLTAPERENEKMWIETVTEMVKRNQDVRMANLNNVEEISTRKSGWGYIKIAIPNELAQRLLIKQDMNGGLLLFDKAQFKAIEHEAPPTGATKGEKG